MHREGGKGVTGHSELNAQGDIAASTKHPISTNTSMLEAEHLYCLSISCVLWLCLFFCIKQEGEMLKDKCAERVQRQLSAGNVHPMASNHLHLLPAATTLVLQMPDGECCQQQAHSCQYALHS